MKLKSIFNIVLLGIFSLLVSFSCSSNKNNNKQEHFNPEKYKEPLQKANKYLVKEYAERIKKYVDRHGWNMKQTETGLWYEIYYHGKGKQVKTGDFVKINYDVYLLDGTLCYSSDSLGPKEFTVGHGGVESGLEEGILMLREGDKARFIMPPYLAHGLLGDDNKIPPLSIILYYVEVLKVYGK
jgi:FKBP-type peptidyl-prolyl cis-trans isomerase FkpA